MWSSNTAILVFSLPPSSSVSVADAARTGSGLAATRIRCLYEEKMSIIVHEETKLTNLRHIDGENGVPFPKGVVSVRRTSVWSNRVFYVKSCDVRTIIDGNNVEAPRYQTGLSLLWQIVMLLTLIYVHKVGNDHQR